jgi:hypothetical protein
MKQPHEALDGFGMDSADQRLGAYRLVLVATRALSVMSQVVLPSMAWVP